MLFFNVSKEKGFSFWGSLFLFSLLLVLITSCGTSKSISKSELILEQTYATPAEIPAISSRISLLTVPRAIKLKALAPLKSKPFKTFSIVAVGDMMLGTNYPDPKYLPPNGGRDLLTPLHHHLQQADLTIGNLEGTLFDGIGKVKSCKNPDACYAFRSPESYINHFVNAGFDLLSLANNHSGDFGPEGRKATKKSLDNYGIKYSGLAGTDEIAYKKVDDFTFAFICFAPNSGTVDIRNIRKAVSLTEEAKRNADIIIVSFHGGAEGPDAQHVTRQTEEYYNENRGNVYRFSHAVIDAGADLVLGHGPHVTRAIEGYKGKLIAYSLGNFATYGRFNLRGPNGYAPLLKLQIDQYGNFISGEIVSIYQTKPTGPREDKQQRALSKIKTLSQEDFPESEIEIFEDGALSKKY